VPVDSATVRPGIMDLLHTQGFQPNLIVSGRSLDQNVPSIITPEGAKHSEVKSRRPIALQKGVHTEFLYGIGVAIDFITNGPVIVQKVANLRNRAGLLINCQVQEGDTLLAVDGVQVQHEHEKEVSENMICGVNDSEVTLTLQSQTTKKKYIVVCKRHVLIRSLDKHETVFTASFPATPSGKSDEQCTKQRAHSSSEFLVGVEVVELLNRIQRLVSDESGHVLDLLKPLHEWQVRLCVRVCMHALTLCWVRGYTWKCMVYQQTKCKCARLITSSEKKCKDIGSERVAYRDRNRYIQDKLMSR